MLIIRWSKWLNFCHEKRKKQQVSFLKRTAYVTDIKRGIKLVCPADILIRENSREIRAFYEE